MNKEFKYRFSAVVVFLIIIWAPSQAYVVIDGAHRIPFFLSLLTVLIYLPEIRTTCFRKPMAFYLILAPYMFINGLAHNSQSLYAGGGMGVYMMLNSIIKPVLLMLIVVCQSNYKIDGTLKYITITVLVYCLLCFFSGKMVDIRVEGERLEGVINSNEVALMIAVGFMLTLLLFIRKQLRIILFVLLEGAFVLAVMATGSRMGFIMIGIVAILTIIMLREKRKIGSLLLSLVFLGGIFVFLNYVMENTYIGERLMTTTTQTESTIHMTGTILDKFGDRGLQYYYGWPFFISHPVFGIGFHQWIKFSPSGHVCHSEYLVQSLECGIIGFVFYMSFFVGLIHKLWRQRFVQDWLDSKTINVLFCSMIAIAFANIVLWTYTSTGIFAIYGIAYALIINYQESFNQDQNQYV